MTKPETTKGHWMNDESVEIDADDYVTLEEQKRKLDASRSAEESTKNQDDIEDDAEETLVSPEVIKPETAKQVEEDEAEEEDPSEQSFGLLKKYTFLAIKVGLWILLIVYLLAAFIIDFQRAIFLFVCTVLALVYVAWEFWASRNEERVLAWEDNLLAFLEKTETDLKYALAASSFLIIIMVILMAVSVNDARNLISLFGLLVFVVLTWIFSWKPLSVKVRPVLGAVFVQFIFGYIVIRTSWGLEAIQFLADQFTYLLGYTYAGSGFVFGYLVDGQLFARPFQLVDGGEYFLAPPLFFNVLPSVIFFSALVSMGYYLRILPFLVRKIGYFIALCLGTSASESLAAAGNIFVGQTEAPLIVRPFVAEMTESELHAIMTGGFATIAGSVFGIYVSFGIDPVAILAASAMSAPAALAISKVAFPETEESPTSTGKKGAYDIPRSDHVNVIHAATDGAIVGTQLMLNIAGNLIAFLAIIAMLDAWLYYLGERVDIYLSFNAICEVVFYPVAWLMGVDTEDCREIAIVLGLKIFANEFVAYEKLAFTLQDQISERSYYIASYALCGFSNFGSIGIQLGGLTPLAPNQGKKLAKLVLSAMIAGNTACLMTACIAGIFYEEGVSS